MEEGNTRSAQRAAKHEDAEQALQKAEARAAKLSEDLAAANQRAEQLSEDLEAANKRAAQLNEELVSANQRTANLNVLMETEMSALREDHHAQAERARWDFDARLKTRAEEATQVGSWTGSKMLWMGREGIVCGGREAHSCGEQENRVPRVYVDLN